jgi:crotonobetainyl-CoA:carnitine CoA-transferase CaiB-like acyl-CoA transferase
MSMMETKQALDGVKVVEFAVYAAGPMVGKHLAEQGDGCARRIAVATGRISRIIRPIRITSQDKSDWFVRHFQRH